MSDINLDFIVSNNNIDFTVQPNDITITPTDVQLNLYLAGTPLAATAVNANISNVHIYGGTNGYVLQTDGTGNLTWTAQTGGGGGNGSPGGSNTQIQYNDSGSFNGYAGFTFDETTGNVNMPSDLNVVGNITANYIIGNLGGNAVNSNYAAYAGNVTIANQPNITSLGTLASLSVAGNSNTGNIYTSGVGGNISGANVIFANTFSATGNISASNFSASGNISAAKVSATGNITAGNVSATGNITANYLLGNGSQLTGIPGGTNISNGNSNVSIATANGNVTITAGGVTTLTISNSNITGTQFISNVATGTAPFVVTSNTIVANLRAATASFANNTANAQTVYSLTQDSTVGSLTANTYIVPLSNNSATLGFTGQRFSNLFVGNINFNGTLTSNNLSLPSAAVSTTITNKIPIVINGTTYYICLTSAV